MVYLTAEETEKRELVLLETALFSGLKASMNEGYAAPIVVDNTVFGCCDLIDSWKSTWLGIGGSYPVPVGPGGVRKEEYVELLGYRKNIMRYLELRLKYPQQAILPQGIEQYAESILNRIEGSLSNLDDWQHLAETV